VDFFGAQDLARRRTWRLAVLFGAAVLSLVVMTNLLVALVYAWVLGFGQGDPLDAVGPLRRLPADYWFWITVAVVGIVAAACLYKYLWLRGGGRAVAESLGGRLVSPATDDPAERRLLNVVEEMAIASGLPVPPVYVVPAPSINAFAAGLGYGDAVIGVNRGTLDHLDRDELQGVVGHEFSHLLNGDSRLNLRLLALLHGILFIGLVGEVLLRGAGRSSRRRSVNARGGSAGLPILVLGLGLALIGYAGTFFGKLIKAAVSRQREYLADAAAVQFTRNPLGIAGALKKIGALAEGSRMRGAAAHEASHLFFGPVARAWLGGLTSTHPPLAQRIRAIDPAWDGRFPVLAAANAGETPPAGAPSAGRTAQGDAPDLLSQDIGTADATTLLAAATAKPTLAAQSDSTLLPDAVSATVGRVDDRALEQAGRLIGALPADLRAAAHDPWAARALTFALVLAGHPSATAERTARLVGDAALAGETLRLLPLAAPLDEAHRLVLVELAAPSLKTISAAQFVRFRTTLIALMGLDRRIDLFEWVLYRVLLRDLQAHFGLEAGRPRRAEPLAGPGRGPGAWRPRSPPRTEQALATLLSALAREESPGSDPETAFRAGLALAGLGAAYDGAEDPDFRRLSRALAELGRLPPLQKPRVIKACAATVLADGRISPRQGALLQGIAAALECPLPPAIHGAWRDA